MTEPALVLPNLTRDAKVQQPAFENMAVAGALSLFAGVFLAFFLEYWERITWERGEGGLL